MSRFHPPQELAEHLPLLDAEGLRLLERIRQHPDAPRWNHVAGDRLRRDDLVALDALRAALESERRPSAGPSEAILAWVADRRPRVVSFRERIPEGLDLARDFAAIPTSSREDVALRVETLVPEDEDLERMIVYRTAGTTGHALLVPHAPRAVASYLPLLEHALARWGLRPRFGPGRVAAFLVGAQARTVTFPTVLSGWGGAGFAKLNLAASEWPHAEAPGAFFDDLEPTLLTGDPISFSELLRLGIPARPAAMVTTAVAMGRALRERLSERYGCPVIEWYSLTETGPIGYGCPGGEGYHVLPHDLHVEVLDQGGLPVADGARGEIAVTGGRNPFLPLLRYRTGDFGRIDRGPCTCGDPMPRLLELEGRAPVLLRARDGSPVNPVDVSRVLRELPLVQHELTQHRDLSCELVVREIAGASLDADRLARALRGLLGDVPLQVRFDPTLGDRKVVPYKSELLLEE